MRVDHDGEANAIYIWLCELAYAFGVDLHHARRIDDAEDSRPIGIELLNVSKGVTMEDLPERATVERLLADRGMRLVA